MGKKGGKQPGAGRPKGTLGVKALTQIELKNRIAQNAESILNAHLAEAKGTHYVYRLNPIAKQYVLVTDADEIREALDRYNGTGGETGGDLYVVTAAKPDVKAGQYLFDRAFGKPAQSIEITDESAKNWKSAVQQLIETKTVENAKNGIALLKEVGYLPPNEQVEREVINEIGAIG